MATPGLCAVCSAPALSSCALCGRVVCARHYNAAIGACTAHAEGGPPVHGRV